MKQPSYFILHFPAIASYSSHVPLIPVISSPFQLFPAISAISSHFQPFSSHVQPFLATSSLSIHSSNFWPFPAISSHFQEFQPCVAIYNQSQPCIAIISHYKQFRLRGRRRGGSLHKLRCKWHLENIFLKFSLANIFYYGAN